MNLCLSIVISLISIGFSKPIELNQKADVNQIEDLYFEGSVSWRGSELPIRIRFESDEDNPQVYLDIPSLMMAWEPISTEKNQDEIVFEFPFGIGKFNVDFQNDPIKITRKLGDHDLTLQLKRVKKPPFTVNHIEIPSKPSKDSTIKAQLVLPDGKGPFPAVVLLHGSTQTGTGSWEYRSWADYFVRKKIAVLMYEKNKMSTANPKQFASLDELSTDGLAVVRYLEKHPKIDSSHIGLKGSSEGAWVAEKIAHDHGSIDYLILTSAAAGTPRQQETQKLAYRMRQNDHSQNEIEEALSYVGLYYFVASTGKGWDLLEHEISQLAEKPWAKYVDQPHNLEQLHWWNANYNFHPNQYVKDLKCPTLLLYGQNDWITPPREHADRLVSLFPDSEKIVVHALDNADHRLEVQPFIDEDGTWHWPQLAPKLFPVLDDWLDRHLLSKNK